MRLAEYLEEKKISDSAFAAQIGTSTQSVHRYKSGQRFPRPKILSKIFEISGGQITANDFAVLPKLKRRKAA